MKFAIESLGCAKNQVDAELLIASLEGSGLRWVGEPEEAEAVIVNTCGFITSAKEESIRTALELKSRFPGKRVILAGCLVARYGPELAASLGELDGFVGLFDPEGLQRLLVPAPPPAPEAPLRRTRLLSYPGSAYVKVAEGCGNRCSYCAIPLIRGPLASRPRSEVVREVAELLERGVHEIILIAQDLASYGVDRGGPELLGLLREIASLRGEFWLRLLYIHPDHFPHELPQLMASDPRFLPYFDLPFQHASEAVLSRMGRRGAAESYLALIRSIRGELPGAVVRSTFLVGFPGETEEDFRALLDFQRAAGLDWLGVFAYSREEGTPAYGFPGRVSRRTAERRKRAIERTQVPITEARLQGRVGTLMEVLIEERLEGEGLAIGRSYLHAPEVDGLVVVKGEAPEPGRFCRVRIERRNGVDMEASLA